MTTIDDNNSPKQLSQEAKEWQSPIKRRERQEKLRRVIEAELSALRREQRAALWQLRQVLDLSQEQLAQLLGVSAKSIFRYEKGSDPVPFSVAYKLRDLAHQKGVTTLSRTLSSFWSEAMRIQLNAKITDTNAGWTPNLIKFHPQGEDVKPPAATSSGERTTELVRTLIEMWNVYQPQMNAAEERIHDGIDRLLRDLAKELRLEHNAVQPKPHGRPTKEKKKK